MLVFSGTRACLFKISYSWFFGPARGLWGWALIGNHRLRLNDNLLRFVELAIFFFSNLEGPAPPRYPSKVGSLKNEGRAMIKFMGTHCCRKFGRPSVLVFYNFFANCWNAEPVVLSLSSEIIIHSN